MIFNEADIRLKFGVLADIHATADAGDRTNTILGKAYEKLKELGGGKLDCIAIPGDLTQWGRPDELVTFNKLYCEHYKAEETPLIYCSGNHDNFYHFYDHFTGDRFEKRMEEVLDEAHFVHDLTRSAPELCRHAVVNGVHFICVNANDYVLPGLPYTPEVMAWFEQEMEAAAKADPGMPIIVLSHLVVSNTVCGGDFNCGIYVNLTWHHQQLRPILTKYPQAIYFSGHTHYSANGDHGIMQDGFTAINCPPVSYLVTDFGFWQCNKGFGAIPAGCNDHPGGLYVEIDGNGAARVVRYDFGLDAAVREPWIIPSPSDPDLLKAYSADRRNIAIPDFPTKDLAASFEPVREGVGHLKLTFSAAESESQIYFYDVEVVKNRVPIVWRKYLTDYYQFAKAEECAKNIEIDVGEIEMGGTIWVTVTPFDIWRNPGVSQRVVLSMDDADPIAKRLIQP